MHLQPSHFSFGPQGGPFYRGQFVIWPRVLIIMRVVVLLREKAIMCNGKNPSPNFYDDMSTPRSIRSSRRTMSLNQFK